jgi:hypothetical protein
LLLLWICIVLLLWYSFLHQRLHFWPQQVTTYSSRAGTAASRLSSARW